MIRIFDLIFSIISLILLFPIFIIIALCIKLDSKGPVFFKQARLGKNEKPFEIYKFRTMHFNTHDPEELGIILHKHPLVTRIGSFLRKYKLDEIPQFINVIKNDMSLVGPRPWLVTKIKSMSLADRKRFSVLPGITGWAEINGHTNLDRKEQVLLDLWYVEHRSLWLNIKILFRTIGLILFGPKKNLSVLTESKKKIVFIASYPDSLILFRLHLMKEFLSNGWDVIALAPYDQNVENTLKQNGIKFNGISLERNGTNFIKDIIFFKNLYSFLRREKPNTIFTYTIKPVIYGSIAGKLSGVPNCFAMLTGTGYVFANLGLKNKIVGLIGRTLLKFSLKFNKKLFFQNKDNLDVFLKENIIHKNQPVAIINGSGVDIDFFTVHEFPQNFTFLMIARYLVDKGLREYADAARRIKSQYPNVRFRLAGWLDSNPNAIDQKELDEWTKTGLIENLGKLDDVRGALAEASVYVLPSYAEGTPRTVLEAMAMGRPIITTDAPGCRETVINQKNGFLVQTRSSDALYAAMEYFIKNQDCIPVMGKVSREVAETKYDVNKVNATLLSEMGL